MKRRMGWITLLVLMVIVVVIPANAVVVIPANALAQSISECKVIDKPGYYVLQTDLTVNKTKCIEIKSSDVIFDGGNHAIKAGPFGGTYGVFVYSQAGLGNVTVKSTLFENWIYGVFLRDVSTARMQGITTKGGFFGIYFTNVANLMLKDCSVFDTKKTAIGLEGVKEAELSGLNVKNAKENGILILDSEKVSIRDSRVKESGYGFYVKNSADVEISKCKSISNEKFGLYVYNSQRVAVSGFRVQNNNLDGIKLYGSSDCRIYSSSFDGNRNGIFLEGTERSRIIENIISNSENGVFISNSGDNYITSNDLLNNKKGLVSASSSYNLFNSNRISGGVAIIFYDTSSSTITDNRIEAEKGIFLMGNSHRNLIYLNTLVAQINAYDEGEGNLWYSSKLKKGNYYSDYKGTDAYGDGIGDQDYLIPPNNVKDIYPLLKSPSAVEEVKKENENVVSEETPEPVVTTQTPATVEESMADLNTFEFIFGVASLLVIAVLIALLKRDRIL